jgi:ribose 5-phosphate isomerase B
VKIAIGSDHAGFRLKEKLEQYVKELGHEVDDLGTHTQEPTDYPPICAAVAREVRDGRAERGIVIGGSGQGEQIAANKVRGIRAALCNDLFTARLSRAHNDANVLALGARIVAPALAREIVAVWLDSPFEGGRHLRRVEQIAEIEEEEAGTA